MHHTTVSKKEAYSKPSQEEWEAVRLTIRQLYIDENKTLSEVSETLAKLYGFRASPKQYKNRFKQWGLWKNLSTRDAARLIQMKASRDSIGKTSTFVRTGQRLDFDRVQKTIRRSKNRAPKIAAEVKRPKLGQADPAPPACNQPSRVECRTPSPEPLPAKDGLDFLDSLDSSILRVDGVALDRDFSTFEPEAFLTHVSESFMISPVHLTLTAMKIPTLK
ncbi:Clr5 domain-containing protein [Diaporthe sp. PMI_573]|nr:Clr5 domain-containing protein [Diaporthaceae sp. PMI_573]